MIRFMKWGSIETTNQPRSAASLDWANRKRLYLSVYHSSEIRGLCLMKWPGEMLQHLPESIHLGGRDIILSTFYKHEMENGKSNFGFSFI